MRLDTKNIVQFIGCVTKDNMCMIVMEYCKLGSLYSYIKKYNVSLSLKLYLMMDISSGLGCLHKCKIIHNDLATRNILVDKDINDQIICKITDYGLSKTIDSTIKLDEYTKLPIRWCAPEVLKNRNTSYKSDIWSYGMTIYEIYTNGKQPFYEYSDFKDVLEKIEKGHIPDKPISCPLELYKLMKICWYKTPEKRPNTQQISQYLSKL